MFWSSILPGWLITLPLLRYELGCGVLSATLCHAQRLGLSPQAIWPDCNQGIPHRTLFLWVLGVLPVQGSSLTCSLSAIKPLFPLLSSLGSVLVKGNSFPSTLESLSTLSLPLTPFPQNPQTHTYTYTHTHSLFEYKSQRNSKAFFFFFWSFCPIISLPWNSEPLANYLLE